jgi:hypothetical protein
LIHIHISRNQGCKSVFARQIILRCRFGGETEVYFLNIIVLCGGLSPERDVSIVSGSMAAAALRRLGHRLF